MHKKSVDIIEFMHLSSHDWKLKSSFCLRLEHLHSTWNQIPFTLKAFIRRLLFLFPLSCLFQFNIFVVSFLFLVSLQNKLDKSWVIPINFYKIVDNSINKTNLSTCTPRAFWDYFYLLGKLYNPLVFFFFFRLMYLSNNLSQGILGNNIMLKLVKLTATKHWICTPQLIQYKLFYSTIEK